MIRATTLILFLLSLSVTLCAEPGSDGPAGRYLWMGKYDPAQSIEARIPLPGGYERTAVKGGSFGEWLRHLPLKEGVPAVLLFDGTPKADRNGHVAVINMDVGNKDLQQCADSVIRLRAEYLFVAKVFDQIHFRFTSGHVAEWSKYAAGGRPTVKGSKVVWSPAERADSSYASFHRYLELVFTYAGTRSLSAEMQAVEASSEVQIGDVFVQAGSPGHAVIVVDTAVHPQTGKRLFLLAQGYMPAQEMHVLRNPGNAALSPWYEAELGPELRTPDWVFARECLRRF
jgi:Domain of unknown function (4846)